MIEGVNGYSYNKITLHTDGTCQVNGQGQLATQASRECSEDIVGAEGCDANDPRKTSFGPGFNSNGGGIYAMEWTSSWFDAYPNSPTKQPDFGQKLKVVRGGGWISGSSLAQTWYRCVNRPHSRTMWVGFRCAKDVS